MAKRYKSMPMHESSERAMEARDSGMLSEDRSAIANMPQNVIYREFPKESSYSRSQLDDKMSGIDRQQKEDVRKMNKQKTDSMY